MTRSIMRTPADISEVVSRYPAELGIRCDSATQPPAGFSGALVLRLESEDSRRYALRRWGNRSLNQRRLRGLHRLLRWVHDAGVSQVAVPVTANDGQTFVVQKGYCWQLEPWLPGTADYWQRPNRDRLRDAMHRLADWHRAAAGFPANATEREWFRSNAAAPSPTVQERLRKLLHWQRDGVDAVRRMLRTGIEDPGEFPESPGSVGEELTQISARIVRAFEALAPSIAAELQRLATTPFRLQPCLRDVWHDHVLFTGDAVTGLIDPTACRTANVATDLSRLLGSLVDDDRAAWEFALDCYAGRAGLTDRESELVRALDRSGVLLSGCTWLDRLWLQQQRPGDFSAVIERLRRITRRLEVP